MVRQTSNYIPTMRGYNGSSNAVASAFASMLCAHLWAGFRRLTRAAAAGHARRCCLTRRGRRRGSSLSQHLRRPEPATTACGATARPRRRLGSSRDASGASSRLTGRRKQSPAPRGDGVAARLLSLEPGRLPDPAAAKSNESEILLGRVMQCLHWSRGAVNACDSPLVAVPLAHAGCPLAGRRLTRTVRRSICRVKPGSSGIMHRHCAAQARWCTAATCDGAGPWRVVEPPPVVPHHLNGRMHLVRRQPRARRRVSVVSRKGADTGRVLAIDQGTARRLGSVCGSGTPRHGRRRSGSRSSPCWTSLRHVSRSLERAMPWCGSRGRIVMALRPIRRAMVGAAVQATVMPFLTAAGQWTPTTIIIRHAASATSAPTACDTEYKIICR